MEHGYLAVETHRNRPGMVRLVLSTELPRPGRGTGAGPDTRLRYAARFNDRDAALMHTHEILKRRLIDPDAHLYRAEMAHAIAAIESIGLSHRDVYIDPELDDTTRQAIETARRAITAQRRRYEHLFETIGYIGIGLLLFNLFVLSFA